MYAVSSPFIAYLAKKMPIRYITQISFFVGTIGLLFLGPSHLLGFPKGNIPMTLIGLACLGFTTATVFVPLLAEIIDAVEESEGIIGSTQINDKASALFNTAGASGTIIGPILGGALYD